MTGPPDSETLDLDNMHRYRQIYLGLLAFAAELLAVHVACVGFCQQRLLASVSTVCHDTRPTAETCVLVYKVSTQVAEALRAKEPLWGLTE